MTYRWVVTCNWLSVVEERKRKVTGNPSLRDQSLLLDIGK